MKNWHKEKFQIDETHVDFSLSVPIYEQIKMFEVATFKHSTIMGLDYESMINKANAFWVVTKMKAICCSPISVGDNISVTTWTHELGTIRALRDCVIRNKNMVKTKFVSEWCCLDSETRKLKRMSLIPYPEMEMEKNKYVKTSFSNVRVEVSQSDYVYTKLIRSTDIDMNNHTNNLKYSQMAFDVFSVEELKSFVIKEYEIYFVNESHEGDQIHIFKKRIKNVFYIEGKTNEKTVFRVVIKVKQ